MEKTIERDKQVIQNLLSQVSNINKKYEELAKVTGENFNVFRVLKIHSDEVRMHSALLGELLSPHGSHGQKDVFLKLFIEQYNKVGNTNLHINNFITQEAKVDIEKHIGAKTEIEGGRIDILITDSKGKKIIIENKIYAGDQEHQLVRYFKHDEASNLCYLTLDGKTPTDVSIKYINPKTKQVEIDLTGKFVQLSYKYDIVNWLEYCLKEAVKHSMLRETIAQYINLIKHLTNQSTNQIMEQEVMNVILKDKDNLTMAMKLSASGDSIQRAVLAKFLESLFDVKRETGYDLLYYSQDRPLGHFESKLKFSRTPTDKFCISIEFENYDILDIGVSINDNYQITEELRSEIFNKMSSSKFANPKKSNGWPWYVRHKAWDDSVWWDVLDGNFKKELYKDILYIDEFLGNLIR